jgi:hypothetical protein
LKERYNLPSAALVIAVVVLYALSGCVGRHAIRYEIPSYPRINQTPEVADDDTQETTTTRFSTQDPPETVKQFYEQGLAAAGWSVEIGGDEGIIVLPTTTPDGILIHGKDYRGCPFYFVEVIIEPFENIGSNVTIISWEPGCT